MIKSKFRIFSPSNFGLLFILLFDSGLFGMFLHAIKKPYFESGIIFGFIVFVFVNGLFLFYYIRANPRWALDNNILTIKHFEGTKYVIDLKELSHLSVTGIKNIILVFNFPARIDSIELQTQERSYFITIDNYSNTHLLQKELSKFYFHKTDNDFIIQPIITKTFDNLITINKWKMFNFHSVYLVALSVLLIYVSTKMNSKYETLFYVGAFLLFALSGRTCPYITYNDEYIIIRNNIYFWQRKAIRIDDIIGFVTIQGGKAPDYLIITFKDFKKYSLISNSIGIDNLHELLRKCAARGISVS